jgi:hypothetical protein
MSDKHKRELKRQQKKKDEAKRQQQLDRITPDVREQDVECWLIDAWEAEGWYDLNCLRRLASGRWVIGLIGVNDGLPATGESDVIKDADPTGFHNDFIPGMKEKYDARKVTLKEARELVCGAIEWNKRHGFRIPGNFTEAAAVIGSLDDALPDYQGFASTFYGTLSDLKQLLVRATRSPARSGEPISRSTSTMPTTSPALTATSRKRSRTCGVATRS